jgi:Transglutaminase-like superfamily
VSEFLRDTQFCNFSDPDIGQLADTFRGESDREIAVSVFNFVRDNIAFEVGNWQYSASETFLRRRGTCSNSANLMVALLRRLGIAAGYGVLTVSGPEYFGPIVPARLARKISRESRHIYACVYLDNHWARCDPSDDWALSEATHHITPQHIPVVWDGQQDAVINIEPAHIFDDRFPIADIDDLLSKSSRASLHIPIRIANYFIEFLRQHGLSIGSRDQLEPRFDEWMTLTNPRLYRLYQISHFEDLSVSSWLEAFGRQAEGDEMVAT